MISRYEVRYFFAVDGDYSQWTSWSACSITCGDGFQTRTRLCNSPSPENGGRTCIEQGLGGSMEMQTCKLADCPSMLSYFFLSSRLLKDTSNLTCYIVNVNKIKIESIKICV